MNAQYLVEYGGIYLEDSYFLGIMAEGPNLRLRFLFALTNQHPQYTPPPEGEAHCYREGSILFEQATVISWQAGRQPILQDGDGSFDFGSVELHQLGPMRFRCLTEWFDAVLETSEIRIELV